MEVGDNWVFDLDFDWGPKPPSVLCSEILEEDTLIGLSQDGQLVENCASV